ncbi:MAG: WG repeat-containing protein [Flavobacteriaceae bacterium]|nr:WG repeat-containing protein [Flavobacteriaceae bacterium]
MKLKIIISTLFVNFVLSYTNCFSQEIEEVEETVIESTESSYNKSQQKKVSSIYQNKQHYLTGDIDKKVFIIKNSDTGLFGLQDINGNLLVKPIFESISKYNSSSSRIVVSLGYGKKGVITAKGTYIIPPTYRSIYTYNEKTIFVTTNTERKNNIFNYFGTAILKKSYDRISILNNAILAKENGLYGLFDANGKELFPLEYEAIEYNRSYNFYLLKQNSVTKIVKPDRSNFFSNEYTDVKKIGYNPLFLVTKNNKKGIISLDEKIIVPIKFEDIKERNKNQLYIVKQNGFWGVYDIYFNQFLIQPVYTSIDRLSDNYYAIVSKKGEKFIKNLMTKKTIDISNYGFSNYIKSNRFLTLKSNNKKGLLDLENDKIIVPIQYEYLYIYDGFISAKINSNLYTTYTKNGATLLENGNSIEKIYTNVYKITKNGKAGLIIGDKKALDVTYDIIIPFRKLNLVLLKKNEKYSLLNTKDSKILIKPSKYKITVNEDSSIISQKNKTYFFSLNKLIPIRKK